MRSKHAPSKSNLQSGSERSAFLVHATRVKYTLVDRKPNSEPTLSSCATKYGCLQQCPTSREAREITADKKKRKKRHYYYEIISTIVLSVQITLQKNKRKHKEEEVASFTVLSKILDGFKSRCRTEAEWMYLTPHKIWYRKYFTCWSLSLCASVKASP